MSDCPWCCQWPARPCTTGCPEHQPGEPVRLELPKRLPKESPQARAQRILRLLAP